MNIKKAFLWFYMFAKRLLCRWSFVILLCIIPFLIYGANAAMRGESGVLTVYLCCEDNDPMANEITDSIKNGKSSLLFKKSTSLTEALKALEQKNADAVWYFEDNISQKIKDYADGKNKKPFVKVFQREDNIPLRLSCEKLFGSVYKKLSYSLYKNFVYSEYNINHVPEDTIKEYIGKRGIDNKIVTIETIGAKDISPDNSYLIMPMRGLLALVIMLCGFAAVLLFLNDKNSGRFDWLPVEKHIFPAFAQCMAGVILAGIAVFVSVFLSGISMGFLRELVSMLLFMFAAAGFCLNFCIIFKSVSKLGALIPGFIILMLALSPVFFNLNMLNLLKLALPTHYYLFFLHNTGYLGKFLIYILCVYLSSLILNILISKSKLLTK